MTTLRSFGRAAILGFAAAFLAACGTTESPSAPTEFQHYGYDGLASVGGFDGAIFACKAGGPAGTYYFHAEKSGGGDSWFPYGQDATVEFDGTNMYCVHMWSPLNEASWGAGVTGTVTVSEILPAGQFAQLIRVWDSRNQVYLTPDVTNANSVTVNVDHDNNLFYVKVYNGETPPDGGGEGCTPGYWKAEKHWDSWIGTGYSPQQSIGSVFAEAAGYGLGGFSLVDGLSFKGGSGAEGAARILLRAAIAGLLNSASSGVDYAVTTAWLIGEVNSALDGGDRATMIGLAATLDYYNNEGCPLY